MEVPDVSYARSGDVAIAYQVVGEGPPDLALVPFLANIYTLWLMPRLAARRPRSERGLPRIGRGEGGEVLASSMVKDLVAGSGIEFEDRGLHRLNGIPGEWRLYAVVDA